MLVPVLGKGDNDVVICIMTMRPPPLRTLETYTIPEGMNVFIIADPAVYQQHCDYYLPQDPHPAGWLNVHVLPGVKGLAAQTAECYRQAARHDFRWYFRLDDDLGPKTFVHKDGRFPSLEEVIYNARMAAEQTQVSMVGFNNSSNRYWMGEKIGRTYGLLTGAAYLAQSSENPVPQFIDDRLTRYDDVYMSLAHRMHAGAVGRVNYIGINKRQATAGTVLDTSAEGIQRSRDIILERFPGIVTCEGTRIVNNADGPMTILNWRYKRQPGYKKEP